MAEVIKADRRLELLHADTADGMPVANVVTWRLDPAIARKWGAGAIYCLAHECEQHHVTVSACKNHVLHFCVTGRSAIEPGFVDTFRHAISKALDSTEQAAQK